MAKRGAIATAGLVLVLVVGLAYVVVSFHPALRFAQPATDLPIMRGAKGTYHCYHSQIYRGGSNFDVLVFGSSRTNSALDEGYLYAAERQLGNTPPSVFAFTTPWSNPEFGYFFLRDYLANNPAPGTILVELTPVKKLPGPVHYIHPFFVDIAPFDLYVDVLRSWDFVESKVFAASHFLRLLVRHLDLSLSRLLVREQRMLVMESDDCVADHPGEAEVVETARSATDYAALLRAEVEAVTPELPAASIGRADSLRDSFADNKKMRRLVDQYDEQWRELGRDYRWDSSPTSQRNFDYYARIGELARAHGITLAYYFMPDLLAPQYSLRRVEQLAERLGAPVFTLPHDYLLVSWHHYADDAHVTEAFQGVYSTWFGSVIERAGGD